MDTKIEIGRVYVTAGGWQALVIYKNPSGSFKAAHMRPSKDEVEYWDHNEQGMALEGGVPAKSKRMNFDLEVPLPHDTVFHEPVPS